MHSSSIVIQKSCTADKRFNLPAGAGSDAVHTPPQYSYAVYVLETGESLKGVGLAFTLGKGNELVCQAIGHLSPYVVGQEIETLMSDFGSVFKRMADDPHLRWLGPHKGVIHLALAAVTNACFDLWAKSRGIPLWKLLLDLSPEALVNTLDLSYLEETLSRHDALRMLEDAHCTRPEREGILVQGYRGYDTSVGWFHYDDETVRRNTLAAIDRGFTAIKLKVGSSDAERDIRRAFLLRDTAGSAMDIMLDVNQQWTLPQATTLCRRLADMQPYWIEEPTHPDDILGHQQLARDIQPLKLAMGEHVPNRIVFKNYLQSGAMSFNQVDAVRVGGVSEFLTISLLSRKYGVPVLPHVGDMGQIHQHLVLFNHIGMGHDALFLEYIPHLKEHFKYPAIVVDGYYKTPQEPGSSTDLKTV